MSYANNQNEAFPFMLPSNWKEILAESARKFVTENEGKAKIFAYYHSILDNCQGYELVIEGSVTKEKIGIYNCGKLANRWTDYTPLMGQEVEIQVQYKNGLATIGIDRIVQQPNPERFA